MPVDLISGWQGTPSGHPGPKFPHDANTNQGQTALQENPGGIGSRQGNMVTGRGRHRILEEE